MYCVGLTRNSLHDSVLFIAGFIPDQTLKIFWTRDCRVFVYMRWNYCVGTVIVEERRCSGGVYNSSMD